MQIAKVIPNIRTNRGGIFDYSIGAKNLPYIQRGVLVLVPFRGRVVEGIIIEIKSRSKVNKLKEIIKVIDPTPVIDEYHIKLSKWISDYYLSPLGKTLFLNIVPPAIREINKNNKLIRIQKNSNSRDKNQFLLIGDFVKRLEFYNKKIAQTLKNQRSAIILLPDIDLVKFFKISPGVLKNYEQIIIHAGMSKTQRWQSWNEIRNSSKPIIVIGSSSALFAPVNNLGLIIIDQEENVFWKSDRSPRYHAVKTALALSNISGANIILGSLTPSIENFYLQQRGNLILINFTINKTKSILIVDLNSHNLPISQTLEEKIAQNLLGNKKVILFLDRKGEGVRFGCSDCNWIQICPNCNIPLIPLGNDIRCFQCLKKFLIPNECPLCQGLNLKISGVTTGSVEKRIRTLFPKSKILRLENNVLTNPNNSKWDILISTSYGLKFSFPKIGLVGIICADQSLNIPDFRGFEKTFAKIYKFLNIAETGVIQTNLPENNFIASLAKLDYKKFYLKEINLRKKFLLPPMTNLIKLIYRNKDENTAKKISIKISQALKNNFKQNGAIVSEASPAFMAKKNGYFRWHILIKIPNKRPKNLDEYLLSLKSGWIIDIDPVDML